MVSDVAREVRSVPGTRRVLGADRRTGCGDFIPEIPASKRRSGVATTPSRPRDPLLRVQNPEISDVNARWN